MAAVILGAYKIGGARKRRKGEAMVLMPEGAGGGAAYQQTGSRDYGSPPPGEEGKLSHGFGGQQNHYRGEYSRLQVAKDGITDNIQTQPSAAQPPSAALRWRSTQPSRAHTTPNPCPWRPRAPNTAVTARGGTPSSPIFTSPARTAMPIPHLTTPDSPPSSFRSLPLLSRNSPPVRSLGRRALGMPRRSCFLENLRRKMSHRCPHLVFQMSVRQDMETVTATAEDMGRGGRSDEVKEHHDPDENLIDITPST